MTWFTKLCLVLVLGSLPVVSWAQRINFNSAGAEAVLETHLLPAASLQKGDLSPVELHLTLPGLNIERSRDGFDALTVPGLTPMVVPGNPELYGTGSLIAVPEGFEPTLEIVSQDSRDLNGVMIAPVQSKFRCHGGDSNAETFAFNSALYDSNSVFPKEVANLEEVGRLQDLRLVRVALNPLQMDMASHSMKVTSDLRVRVSFQRTRASLKPITLARSFYQLATTVTANGPTLPPFLIKGADKEVMIVVVADEFQNDIAPFIAWKRSKGLEVVVYTFTQAGATKEKVKATVQQYYASHDVKPTYLLFVGNGKAVPPFMESTSSGSAASDYPFSLLSGNDPVPDLFYGRLIADNAAELKTQVDRWIAYEKTPDLTSDWYTKGTTIASNQGSGPSDKEYAQQIQTALKAYTYKLVDGFYQGDNAATYANISNATNEGRSWIAYIGHGSGTSWASTNDTFNVASVATLKNADKLPFVVDVACMNASYVRLPKCFGKAWMVQTVGDKPAGAVAYYGGSVNVSWHPPAVMSVGVAKYHFEKGIPSVGGSAVAGQLYLIEKMGTGSQVTDNLKWYNLFGDPSLVMRTDTPKAYQVKYAVASDAGVSVKIDAQVSDGVPVQGLLASVTAGGNTFVAKTDAGGLVTIPLTGIATLSGAKLVTTGTNLATYEFDLN